MINRNSIAVLFEEWVMSIFHSRKALELLESRNGLYVLYIDRVTGELSKQVSQVSLLQKIKPEILDKLLCWVLWQKIFYLLFFNKFESIVWKSFPTYCHWIDSKLLRFITSVNCWLNPLVNLTNELSIMIKLNTREIYYFSYLL